MPSKYLNTMLMMLGVVALFIGFVALAIIESPADSGLSAEHASQPAAHQNALSADKGPEAP